MSKILLQIDETEHSLKRNIEDVKESYKRIDIDEVDADIEDFISMVNDYLLPQLEEAKEIELKDK